MTDRSPLFNWSRSEAKQTCTRAECEKWPGGSPECVGCKDRPALTYRAEPAPRFRCKCGTEDLVTRNPDGTLIDEMRCPGCDRIWKRPTDMELSTPIWACPETYIRREGDGLRNAEAPATMPPCADDCGSPGTADQRGCDDCDMREQKPTIREKRLAQKPLKLRGVPCPECDGKGGVAAEDDTGPGWFSWHDCKRCGGTGEIL